MAPRVALRPRSRGAPAGDAQRARSSTRRVRSCCALGSSGGSQQPLRARGDLANGTCCRAELPAAELADRRGYDLRRSSAGSTSFARAGGFERLAQRGRQQLDTHAQLEDQLAPNSAPRHDRVPAPTSRVTSRAAAAATGASGFSASSSSSETTGSRSSAKQLALGQRDRLDLDLGRQRRPRLAGIRLGEQLGKAGPIRHLFLEHRHRKRVPPFRSQCGGRRRDHLVDRLAVEHEGELEALDLDDVADV